MSIISRHAITFLLIFPPLVAQLAKADLQSTDVSSIKWLLSAGATIPNNLRQSLRQRFPAIDLTMEWGTSETMLIAIQTDSPGSRKPGSSGLLVNGMQARVISTDTGVDLGPNEKGEILVRNSLAPFKGYKGNEPANKDFDSNGWFHTGDSGYLDADCNVYIVDRLKELLRVGDGYGSRISVSELENMVFEHPAVRSVVVVGIQDVTTACMRPTAFVKVVDDLRYSAGPALANDILSFTASRLTGLKRLTGGIFFINEYPMTGFKVNRRALKTVSVDRDTCFVPPST